MTDSIYTKIIRIKKNEEIEGLKEPLQIAYFSMIQNFFRANLINATIITINWVVLRRIVQPHLGVIIGGTFRNTAIDFLPSLLYLNYQHNFKIQEYNFMVKYLDNDNSQNTKFLTSKLEQEEIKQRQLKEERKHYFNSQFWH